jgi:hypothetical protein
MLILPLVARAQASANGYKPDFEIKAIRQQQVNAPNYSATSDLGGHPSTLWRMWLKIEVEFTSRPEWADDVQMKYYVLMGKAGDEKMFTGEVTHINVAKGTQHFSAMFMQPNTLQRYGAGSSAAVAVRLFYKGKLMSELTKSDLPVKPGWWERVSPTPGYLLSPQESPWGPIADERFEAIKLRNTGGE